MFGRRVTAAVKQRQVDVAPHPDGDECNFNPLWPNGSMCSVSG